MVLPLQGYLLGLMRRRQSTRTTPQYQVPDCTLNVDNTRLTPPLLEHSLNATKKH